MSPPDAPRHPSKRGVGLRRKNGVTVFVLPAGNCAGAWHGGSARLGGRSRVIEGIPVCTRAASVRAGGPRASLGPQFWPRTSPMRRHRCWATTWMSRWQPSRPLRRSAQAESDAIGRCGRHASVCHSRSQGREPCRSQSALSGVGKRSRVKSFGCVRGDGVRGVPVLRTVARIDERRLVAEVRSVVAERKRSGLVLRGKPQGTKGRRERGAVDALHGVARRALTGSSSEDRRSGSWKSRARSPGQRRKRSRPPRLTGRLRAAGNPQW